MPSRRGDKGKNCFECRGQSTSIAVSEHFCCGRSLRFRPRLVCAERIAQREMNRTKQGKHAIVVGS
jgi:hypothetical protein